MIDLFDQQKKNAKRRRIPWQLTFEQWLDIWTKSGKLRERGFRKGNYVMARFNDVGPYAVGNVKIIAAEENTREGLSGYERPPENRENIARGIKAYWAGLTSEQRAERGKAISAAQLKSGSQLKAWSDPKRAKRQGASMKKAWAKLTRKQRIARGRAISKGRARALI